MDYQTASDIQNDQMKTDLSKKIKEGDDVQSFFRKLFYYAGISLTSALTEAKEANRIGMLVWNDYCKTKLTPETFFERLRTSSAFTELVYGKMNSSDIKLCCGILDLCFKPRKDLDVEQQKISAQARIDQVNQNLQKKKKEFECLLLQIEKLENQLRFQENLYPTS